MKSNADGTCRRYHGCNYLQNFCGHLMAYTTTLTSKLTLRHNDNTQQPRAFHDIYSITLRLAEGEQTAQTYGMGCYRQLRRRNYLFHKPM